MDLRREGGRLPGPATVGDYPRHGNPYTEDPFPGETLLFEHNGQWLDLNWQTRERSGSRLLGD